MSRIKYTADIIHKFIHITLNNRTRGEAFDCFFLSLSFFFLRLFGNDFSGCFTPILFVNFYPRRSILRQTNIKYIVKFTILRIICVKNIIIFFFLLNWIYIVLYRTSLCCRCKTRKDRWIRFFTVYNIIKYTRTKGQILKFLLIVITNFL